VCDLALVSVKIAKPPVPLAIVGVGSAPLMVRATLTVRGVPHTWDFDWNDRESVRRFAADSNVCILAGGTNHVEPAS
jgi:hypothetical protein